MSRITSKREKRKRRHKRVRAKVKGTIAVPRFSIFRSNRYIWVQLIDDVAAHTLVAASTQEISQDKSKKTPHQSKRGAGQVKDKSKKTKDSKKAVAEQVGELIAKRALKKKITRAVFDRGGYKYHGVVRAVAEGARKGGLKM
ncbi:MAG: hypothetical protein A3C07_03540 [Candidatus Sungbacteria bacterium RIFCSPHIGHO2_02_FULL_47_11]|uniref:Large ribosomal subunit protein uL18 n=1 Tax=Candidatus Sungbacteria bacterium RIFCSPHIGHO2_02_FULL_47_11 TaxID=1802270 RepID=A0A1G2KLR1_9BACT|nr:MAG: hypothetical protein A3C07_03540 [Candidatus Sungbacteria bacterium RIFCSPHIGHO2_02_FULL_47_11]